MPADVFARYHRLKGNDVLMVSGTDEHGTPVMVSADRSGVSPRELADTNNALIRKDLRDLGISYDCFTRTTTRNHHRVTQDIFGTLYEKGYLVERTTLGAFSPSTGRTLPDRYIEGTCPICGYPEARGDQCDNCGNQLDPVDLIDPRSIIDGLTPEFRETKHLFLDLPAFAEQLEAWISAQDTWRPNVKNFSLGLVKELKARAMTRDIDWGVPVPVDGYPEDTKRIYVWFDAVIGYLSASVEWAHNRGTPDAWREWWQNPDAGHFYFMGKDNIVFHSVIWPAMLLGYDGGGELGAGRGDLRILRHRRAADQGGVDRLGPDGRPTIGLGLGFRRPGLGEGGFGAAFLVFRLGQLVAGDGAGLGQALATAELGAGAVQVGLGAHDLGVGLGDVGGAHGDLAAQRLFVGEIAVHLAGGLIELGLGLVQRDLGVGGIDLHQHLALFDRLGVLGENLDDLAGHLRGDVR